MPRVNRSRPSIRRRPTPSLERLEERQLLSTVPMASSVVIPPVLPALQAGDFAPVASPSVVALPSAIYTPAQVRTAYGLNSVSQEGQGETIAIVDAYSQPDIVADIATFSTDFGLPQMNGVGGNPTLSIMVPTGQTGPNLPPANIAAGIEISLDVEYVHTIAPMANIDLVLAQNLNGDSLYGAEVDGAPFASAVGFAETLPGVTVVSNSYGSSEFSGENSFDPEFTTPKNNVAFVFSTGDFGAPGQYPANSPNVVAVGGTSLYALSFKGQYGKEIGWSGSGGGVSQFETTPSFQSANGVNFGMRSTPDVSMLADPNTGVFVLDSFDGGLFEVGGTSLSAPMWAGVIALGDQARGSAGALSSTGVLNSLYGAYDSSNYLNDFHDVTTGNNGFAAGTGYDLVTGIGTPKVANIITLLGAATPGVVVNSQPPSGFGGGSGTNIASIHGSRDSFTNPSLYDSLNGTATNTAFLAGSLSDLITATTTPSAKKTVGLLSGE